MATTAEPTNIFVEQLRGRLREFFTVNPSPPKDHRPKRRPAGEELQEHQRSIGTAHALNGEVRKQVELGIAAAKKGDGRIAALCLRDATGMQKRLNDLNMPAGINEELRDGSGQELAELALFIPTIPYVIGGGSLADISFPTMEELGVNLTAALAGAQDLIGELKKGVADYFEARESLPRKKRIEMRKKFLKLAREVNAVLAPFETFPSSVVDNTSRRGYGNTFVARNGRLGQIIEEQQRELLRDNHDEQFLEEIRALLGRKTAA